MNVSMTNNASGRWEKICMIPESQKEGAATEIAVMIALVAARLPQSFGVRMKDYDDFANAC